MAHYVDDLPGTSAGTSTSGPENSNSLISSTSKGPYVHQFKHHYTHLMNALSELRRDEELCDVVLLAGTHRIPAHRVILAACSCYFKTMFTTSLQESSQREIRMLEIDGQTLSQMVMFCYSGELKITDSSVQQLLPAACLLQMGEIQDPFADTHSCRELARIADVYTQNNFQQVITSDEFLQLSLEHLLILVSSDELHVKSEEQVFEAVKRWIHCDLAGRRQHLATVLEYIRLPLCDPKFLVSVVSEDPLVKADPAARDLVDEAKNYLLLPLERAHMQGPRTRLRRAAYCGEVLYSVGGWCCGEAIKHVERMNPNQRQPKWEQVAPMKKPRCGVGVAVLNGLLYAVGGHDGVAYLNCVERYDPATNQWDNTVAPTTSSRTSVGVAVLNRCLYAVGGQDGVSCLDLVEKYDARDNKWTQVASMGTRRLGVSVSVLKGCLYAIGGSDGQNPLRTVERYDPRTNKWTSVQPMNVPRKHLGTAVFDGKLYAVGGRDDKLELDSAEYYDPITNEWRFIVAMQSRRSGVGLSVSKNKLYAAGGFDGNSYLKSVEVYDPQEMSWRFHSNMNFRRLGGGAATIPMLNVQEDKVKEQQETSESGESPEVEKREMEDNLLGRMLIPKSHRRAIYEYLFNEGVTVAAKDPNAKTHPNIEGVTNLEVMMAMKSLASRELVKQQFAWRHYYWYLTNEGITYLREYLNLPEGVVPATVKNKAKEPRLPLGDRPSRPGPKAEGDRDAYRTTEKQTDAGPGAAPVYRAGFGRGGPAPQ
ncbi:unnamed protein product, partial [Mesorhabditis spiculigera]